MTMNHDKLTDGQAALKGLRQEASDLKKQLIEIDAKLSTLGTGTKSSKQK
jgi:hypothetical protein